MRMAGSVNRGIKVSNHRLDRFSPQRITTPPAGSSPGKQGKMEPQQHTAGGELQAAAATATPPSFQGLESYGVFFPSLGKVPGNDRSLQAIATQRPLAAEARTASQIFVVSSASRKVGEADSPRAAAERKSAT